MRILLGSVTYCYTVDDALVAADQFVTVDDDKWVKIDERNRTFCYTDAGHIIGSAAAACKTHGKQ
jgi:Cft2 family RNA processing exonuclease